MSRVFSYHREVNFAETDMAGVMHFSNYFRLMEEAEHALWRELGESVVTVVDQAEISWPRASVKCDYFAPARFEDQLELRVTIAKMGGKSLRYRCEFFRDDTKIATGETTAVCCLQGAGRFTPVDIPETIRKKLRPLLEDES